MILDGIADETVQAFSLAGGEILNDLPLTFLDDDIDSIVTFFVVSCGASFCASEYFMPSPSPDEKVMK